MKFDAGSTDFAPHIRRFGLFFSKHAKQQYKPIYFLGVFSLGIIVQPPGAGMENYDGLQRERDLQAQ